MDVDAKLRPIYLIDILKERTDEDHYLTTSQLCTILKSEYGIDTHRTTIKSDIEMLQQAGIGIQAVRSTQNQYNFIERDFDTAELKRNLVVDGRNKLENEQILMIVDAINDAINQRRKIRFQKVEYNVNEGLEV